ncbi:MAG: hypothetical protein ACRD28_07975 [Acidobacteriaceae bacterium]
MPEGVQSNYGGYRGTNIVPAIADPGYPPVNVIKRLPAKEFDDFMIPVKSAAQIARSAFDIKDDSSSRKLGDSCSARNSVSEECHDEDQETEAESF